MKPLKLTMSAFASYINKTVIDFTKFGDNGIYLITGDTGSGKTTIFDAISYALFGAGSGDFRKNGKYFRSEYAGLSDETYVELEFLYNDKIYKIRRNPEYQRASKRGNGVTTEKASEALTLPSGKVITNKNNINNEITNLLGIDSRQFRQIVMLPQGAFMKFLMADTANKREIFADIFKTNLYGIVAEKIKENAKSLNDAIEDYNSVISRSIKEIICPETNSVYNEIKQIFDIDYIYDSLGIKTIIRQIEKINAEETFKKNNYEKNLKKINIEIEYINQNLGIHQINRALEETIKKNKSLLEQQNLLLPNIRYNLENISKQLSKVSEIDVELDILKNQISKYHERDNLITEKSDLIVKIEKSEKSIDKIQKDLSQQKINLVNKENTLKKINISNDIEIELNKNIEILKNKYKKIQTVFSKIKQYEDNKKKCDDIGNDFQSALSEYENIRDEYIKKEKLYDSAIAGILAEKLEINQRCPVCGSTEHPHPAKMPDSTPTEHELEKCRNTLEIKENRKNNCREKLANIKNSIALISDDIINEVSEIINRKIFSVDVAKSKIINEKNVVENELNALNNKLNEIFKQKNKAEKICKDIEILENEILQQTQLVENEKTDLFAFKEKIININAKLDVIILRFDNVQQAKEEYVKLENRKNTIQYEYNKALKEYDECSKLILNAESAIKTAEEQLEKENIPDENYLKNKLDDIKLRRDELISKISDINHILETNNNKSTIIKSNYAKMEKKYIEYKYIKELSDLVNGNIKKLGVEQITLEVRVQMIYFLKILRKANIHLLKMTNGQYELTRAGESRDGRKKVGLELNIFDHYSKSERDVKTLSGGESFMASLALAFGMVDEIQSSAGGIRIDTMFIDEGFGTLDDEALNQAVNMLSSLANTDRLIGIISHVPELKNCIERKIIVSKNCALGSKIKIE